MPAWVAESVAHRANHPVPRDLGADSTPPLCPLGWVVWLGFVTSVRPRHVRPHIYIPTMVIDCGSCTMVGLACGDRVVSVLLGPPEAVGAPEVADEHLGALAVLADSGLVPPLRLISPKKAG